MSVLPTKKEYAHGAIVRMKLDKFVTYDSLEFSPGANLNVIIGPNGTGKSTIVCAICLGMAGKPIVLGRAATISDYIKEGFSKATVEIELNNTKGTNYTIRRHLFKDNKSEWFLNNRAVKAKDIEDLVNGLNIQVQNLCQFLPQEKVSEFARLDKYQILESTEKAVGGNALWEKHTELKENSKESRDLERDVVGHEEDLKKEEATNARLDSQVSSWKEKKKFEQSVLWLKRKRACFMYSERRKEYEAIKEKKGTIHAEVEELNNLLAPIEERKKKVDAKIKRQKVVLTSKSDQMVECRNSGRQMGKMLGELASKVSGVKEDYSRRSNEINKRQSEIKKMTDLVELIKGQYEDGKECLVEIEGNESEIREKDKKVHQDVLKLNEKQYEVNRDMEGVKSELNGLRGELTKMRSVREDKLAKLKSRFMQTYKAVMWLDQNSGMFSGAVYEPMFLSINTRDSKAAQYVENTIPNRDLVQMFLFEKSEDMHLFMSEVRDKQKLVVNTALVPNRSSSSFDPAQPIDAIKRHGFSSFVRELIQAPEAILAYLCTFYQVHNIPIGNDYTQNNLEQIKPSIVGFNRIYTSSHSYSFTRSKYTGKTSSSSNEINNGYFLASSIDTSKIGEMENKKLELEGKCSQLNTEFGILGKQKSELDGKLETSRAAIVIFTQRKQFIDNLKKKFDFNTKKLKGLKAERDDIFPDAEKKAKVFAEIAKKRVKLMGDYVMGARNLLMLNKDRQVATYQDQVFQVDKRKVEMELREFTGKKQELDLLVQTIDERIRNAKDEAKSALEAASTICEIRLEKGVPAALKEKFETLPDCLEEIESEIHKCEAISAVSYDVDARVIEEYEARAKLIEKKTRNLEKMKSKLDRQKNNYEELKNGWLEEVEKIIKGVNEKFSRLFKQLKCTGQVELGVPDVPDDFGKYGVKIMVSFRSDEQMQELTAWQQSGGEKSVSTMMYMIALQEMTKCPFRVVDEINQGMDPINERKVFDIIVQNSCSKQFAQYFLLTPKLLPDLCFDERTNVICVFNGPKNLEHTKYDLARFIHNRKQMKQRE